MTVEFINFLVRWGHLLFGITWIGMLYYFNFIQGGYFKSATPEALSDAKAKLDAEALGWIDKIRFRMQAVMRAKKSKYILLNAPNDKIQEISRILPVLKSPTVLPLAKAGWSSLHSVINDGDFWEVIDQLKAAGAEDILVCPIEKMVL